MERVVKPKLKLIDLFEDWQSTKADLDRAIHRMPVSPTQVKAEMKAYDLFLERLKSCNC